MLAEITSLLAHSTKEDEFNLSYDDLKQIAALLQELDLLKQKYSLLKTTVVSPLATVP